VGFGHGLYLENPKKQMEFFLLYELLRFFINFFINDIFKHLLEIVGF
jgi:hypothetical protein